MPIMPPQRQGWSRRRFLGATAPLGAGLLTLPTRAQPASQRPPSWVGALPLWQWAEIPDTALARVEPVPLPFGASGPSAKIRAWNGATVRRAGSVYLIGAAGGHNDYAGNEVDALALGVETPAWTQLRAPTPNAQVLNGSGDGNGSPTQFNLDRRPSATHTYWGTQFIDHLDRMLVFAAPTYSFAAGAPTPAGWGYKSSACTYSFDMARQDWDAPDYVAPFPDRADPIAGLCARHPLSGDVYRSCNGGRGIWRWAANTNTWTLLPRSTARASWYAGSAIDIRRARLLVVGSYAPSPPELYGLDGLPLPARFGGLGAQALELSGYPGVVYDEALDRFLVLANRGATVDLLAVDASTLEVSRPHLSGPAPAARENGILNSFQYLPELRAVVFANDYHQNVKFLRTSGF